MQMATRRVILVLLLFFVPFLFFFRPRLRSDVIAKGRLPRNDRPVECFCCDAVCSGLDCRGTVFFVMKEKKRILFFSLSLSEC